MSPKNKKNMCGSNFFYQTAPQNEKLIKISDIYEKREICEKVQTNIPIQDCPYICFPGCGNCNHQHQ